MTTTTDQPPPIDLLLVDDEPRNLDALEAILGDHGYNLLRAEDADRALRILLEHDVAAIILDIKMPRVNGIELAQIIKGTKRFRQIPILFLTAHLVDDSDVLSGYSAGAVDYLTKPFNPHILRHKVAVFADLFRKTRALAELNDKLEERVKERTSELEKSEAALRAAARQKDEFLAVLAHELRNPLAPLRTGLDLLLQLQPQQNAVVGRTLAAMNRQLDHIVRLIDDLLDVSRISRGVLELKKERADLGQLVTGAVETFRGMFDRRKLDVAVDAPGRMFAHVDPTRVSQIIGNLLHNASKYTPEHGRVTVELRYDGGRATVRVHDTGMGIPADQLERVFEMFARIERKSGGGADRGAGIGLALAKRLAEMHGGTLRADSAGEGRGTTFTLGLPGVTVEERPVTQEIKPLRALGEPLDILVIEDNVDVAETLSAWLEELGHRVQVAHDGAAGLELVLATRPDVVLCDVGLPEMDGVEVCLRVRARIPGGSGSPKMVALTGWGNEDDRKRTAAAGFDHHLVKPVALDVLSEVLSTIKSSRPLLS
jgi:signal transduction histidine kinase|nr:response regulator [Kofleriaceae bacterium]